MRRRTLEKSELLMKEELLEEKESYKWAGNFGNIRNTL
jgi:hypothetical protein